MLRVINSVGVSYEWVGLRSLSRGSFEGARTSNKLEMHALQVIFPLVLFSVVAGKPAELVLLHGGPSMGAACLDGSAPGYYYRAGTGEGMSKWIVHLEGGGWCYNEDECAQRSRTPLGSSKSWAPTFEPQGFLSDNASANADFYDWNVVFVKYCDGASFAGNSDGVINWKGTELHFRGFPILQLVFNTLLAGEMKSASEVILTGCSAGGLATYIHADYVASLLPDKVMFAAMADAGFFIDVANYTGQMHIRELYSYVFKMQNCSSGVNQMCVEANGGEEWRCFFPQYTEPHIKSALFGLNSLYDSWQLLNILQLGCFPLNCPPEKMKAFEKYRGEFLNAAADFVSRDSRGVFFDSCLMHCQSLNNGQWNNLKISKQSARDTFADWYKGHTSATGKEVDCAFPCNPTCPPLT